MAVGSGGSRWVAAAAVAVPVPAVVAGGERWVAVAVAAVVAGGERLTDSIPTAVAIASGSRQSPTQGKIVVSEVSLHEKGWAHPAPTRCTPLPRLSDRDKVTSAPPSAPPPFGRAV